MSPLSHREPAPAKRDSAPRGRLGAHIYTEVAKEFVRRHNSACTRWYWSEVPGWGGHSQPIVRRKRRDPVKDALRRWLAPPAPVGDDAKDLRVRLLNICIHAAGAFVVLVVFGNLLDRHTPARNFAIDLAILVMVWLFRYALRRGRTTFVALGVTASLYLALVAIVINEGTVFHPATASFLLFVSLAGTLFELRGIVASVTASGLTLAGLMLAQDAGWFLPASYKVSGIHWFAFTVTFGAFGGLVHFTNRAKNDALEQTRRESAERKRIGEQLTETNLRLEAAVALAQSLAAQAVSNEQEQRELLDHLQAGVLVIAPDMSVVGANQMAGQLLGVAPGQLRGNTGGAPGSRFVHEDGTALPPEENPVARVLSTRAPVVEQVVGVDRPGSPDRKWAIFNAYPRLDKDGALRHVVVTFSGITERKRAEEQLRLSEERHRLLAENSRDVVWTMSLDGRLTYVNPSIEPLLGFTVAEAMELTLDEYLTPASLTIAAGCFEKLTADLQAGRPAVGFRGEIECRRRDGSTLWTEVTALPVLGPGGAVVEVLGVSRDISERRRVQEARSAQREEIEALNRTLEARVTQAVAEIRAKDQLLLVQNRHAAMGQMIGNIAHQWRQPLNGLGLVLGDVNDASKFGELDAAMLANAVEQCNALIRSMSTTIDDFRHFFQPGKEQVSFSALTQVRDTLALLDASFKNTGIVIEVATSADVSLFGVPNEYCQVLMNLFTNARQAIQGAKRATGTMTVTLSERDGLGVLSIRDDGGGIPEEVLQRLGEPYFTTKDGGTGLGLYMARQIVERSMGGRLEIKNVPGGAEFTMLTPLAGGRAGAPESAP